MRRKIISSVLVFILIMTITGCEQSTTAGTLRVAMIPKVIGITYFDQCADGAREAGEKLGMELIYKGPTTADAASQVNIIQDLIFQNIDVIAIAPVDPDAVEPVLKQARDKGIKVVTYDADATLASRDLFVNQVDSEVLGNHIIDNIAELIGEDGQYAILTASLTADNQNQWLQSMQDYQEEKYPNMDLLTIVPTDEDKQKAYAQTRNLIQAYPDLDGILAMSTEAGPGAAQAFKSLDIKGDVKLYCLSLPGDMKPYIEDGYVQLVTLWDPGELGAMTMESINYLLANGPIESSEIELAGEIREFDGRTNTIIIGEPLDFDKDNIDAAGF